MRVPTEAIRALPGETVCYVPGVGEVTLAEVRGDGGLASEEDATVRMNVLRCLYDPKGKPWRTGRIRVGTREYPASVCLSDQSLPLSTSSGMFADVDVACRSAVTLEELLSRSGGRR